MTKKIYLLSLLLTSSITICAQTGADFLKAMKKGDVFVPFDVNSEGEPFRVKWGMDTAWDWDWNVTRGINYIGKGNFETGRISFQPNDLVTDNGDGTYTLSARQQKDLKWRCDLIKRTGTTEVNINCDHEMLFKDKTTGEDDYTGKTNYQGKPEEWYKLIKASVQYAQKQGLTVVSISPFNEPDYTSWMQYSGSEDNGMNQFLQIAKLIKADPFFDGIRICGGNTLNCDRALPWYNYLKEYLDEGNTHQLAGSFDNYADFFATVKADGKIGTADELHNVGEAIVGANYGMENGIWWGFDGLARGQFCLDSNEGTRIAYAENRSKWTDAAVYRNNKTNEVHGYFGSSERQANASSFTYVSTTKDVYFNGYGPTRMYVYDVPGGTGYQKGQINAERVFDITWGEDVAPGEVNGTYQIMNAYSKKMLTWKGTSNVQSVTRSSTGTTQHWHVYPGYTDGDVSYWFIDNVATSSTKVNLNVQNNNLETNAGVICWDAEHGAVEQWYVKYVGDGYYHIISRLSNKYLCCTSTTSGTNVILRDAPAEDATATQKKMFLWRFQPTDSKAETIAPKVPTELAAKPNSGSISLSWTSPEVTKTVDGAASYTVLRGETPSDGEANIQAIEWNTIGRNITDTTFVDNTAIAGRLYSYKVVAVDLAGNRSEASDMVSAAVPTDKALLCQLQFDKSLADNSANKLGMSLYGTEKYTTTTTLRKSGTSALTFDGNVYGMIPYSSIDNEALTIATWVRWDIGGSSWQRVFDFGNSTTQYMFFTPSNGSEMRFVMKNGGDEQILTNGKKLATGAWHHIAVTLQPLDNGNVEAKLYYDGEVVAESDQFTIRPSDIRPSLCFVGRSMFTSDPFYKGKLDDFRIYNYALDGEGVKAIMSDTGEVAEALTSITISDITDLIDKYLNGEPDITISDITAMIDKYLAQ